MSSAWYNENDRQAAAWLRELIKAGHIAPGVVDERSIEDITPGELAGFTQCHFFAGIGGWSYALRLAGWPDSRPVWSGSCPCQPFSAAGKRAGFADERHLWPAWHWLIAQCRPERVLGEQVASALGWLDLVSTDLEAEGYALGAAVLGAHSVGAPHIRQRLYWVGHADHAGLKARDVKSLRNAPRSEQFTEPSASGELEYAQSDGRQQRRPEAGERSAEPRCGTGELGNPDNARSQGQDSGRDSADQRAAWPPGVAIDWIACRDGKMRPVESGTFPLAHGISGRVGLLRGYGNAIVPQVAQAFIESYLGVTR